jgi:hypothetical protein
MLKRKASRFVVYLRCQLFTQQKGGFMYQEGRKLDFAGQHVFVGLDGSNRSWTVSIQTQSCEYKTFTQPPHVETLVGYLHRHFPGAQVHCVYEAGYHGFWIHQKLTQHGIDCSVVNPADVPTKHKEMDRKTDPVGGGASGSRYVWMHQTPYQIERMN